MLSIRFLIISLLLITNLYSFECEAFDKDSFELGVSRGSLDGYIQVGKENATKLDLKSDLGLNKSENSLQALLNKNYKNHKFSFKVSRFKVTGEKELSNDILYNSANIAKATIAKSKLDLRWAQLKYRYKYSKELSIGTNLNGIRMYSYINGNSKREIFVMPSFAIDYNIDLADDLMLVTKTALTPLGDKRYAEAYMGIAYKLGFSNCSFIHLGYQLNELDIKTDDLNTNLTYNGIYAGVNVKF